MKNLPILLRIGPQIELSVHIIMILYNKLNIIVLKLQKLSCQLIIYFYSILNESLDIIQINIIFFWTFAQFVKTHHN